jgi:hypothetical protein
MALRGERDGAERAFAGWPACGNKTAVLQLERQRKSPRLNGPLLCNPISAILARPFQKGRSKRGEDPSRPNGGDGAVSHSIWVLFLRAGSKICRVLLTAGRRLCRASLPVGSIGDGAMVMRNQ